MSNPEDESFFGKPMSWWTRTSKVNGIKAVAQRWGNPSNITDRMVKIDMLAITLPDVEGLVPQPSFAAVKELISMTNPPAQQPEPRPPPKPRGLQTGVKTKSGPLITNPKSTPKGVHTGVKPVKPNVPLPPEVGKGKGPAEGLKVGEPTDDEPHVDDSTVGVDDDSAEETDSEDTSGTYIIQSRQNTDGQSTPTSAQLLQRDLIGGFATVITRSFHCPPKLAKGFNPTTAPKRPVEAFADPETLDYLSLEDSFNDTDDPCIVNLKLHANDRTYRLDPFGRPHAYRGRGPVWNNDSSPFDCCLVAARLLQIGLTHADSGDEPYSVWESSLDTFHQRCLQVFHEQWELSTSEESIRRRDVFYKDAIAQWNHGPPSQRLKLRTVAYNQAPVFWNLLMSEKFAGQFGFNDVIRTVCTVCGDEGYIDPMHQRCVELKDLGTVGEPSMADMLGEFFGPRITIPSDPFAVHEGCTGEGNLEGTAHLVLDETLPVRLAVKPDSRYRNIREATDDNITFAYTVLQQEDDVGSLVHRTATYRWLGGIYTYKHHCRLYWQDSDYISSTGELKVYDGLKACGAIIGGFLPYDAEHKVPPRWANGTEILFYERLNEDNKDQVLEGVQEMIASLSPHAV
jgi:hypothetical protein